MRIRRIVCIKHQITMPVGWWGEIDVPSELLPEMIEGCLVDGVLYLPTDHPHLNENCILKALSQREEVRGASGKADQES